MPRTPKGPLIGLVEDGKAVEVAQKPCPAKGCGATATIKINRSGFLELRHAWCTVHSAQSVEACLAIAEGATRWRKGFKGPVMELLENPPKPEEPEPKPEKPEIEWEAEPEPEPAPKSKLKEPSKPRALSFFDGD